MADLSFPTKHVVHHTRNRNTLARFGALPADCVAFMTRNRTQTHTFHCARGSQVAPLMLLFKYENKPRAQHILCTTGDGRVDEKRREEKILWCVIERERW